MKKIIAHILYRTIHPSKPTWLSLYLFRLEQQEITRINDQYIKEAKGIRRKFFDVAGAGTIAISESPHCMTGRRVGFSIGVSWGRHGYCGGVLGRDEAMKMASFFTEKCSGISQTEEEEYTAAVNHTPPQQLYRDSGIMIEKAPRYTLSHAPNYSGAFLCLICFLRRQHLCRRSYILPRSLRAPAPPFDAK